MKTLASSYSISGNVVTLTGVNVPLSQILLIADATTGSVLYSIGGPAPTAYTQATNSTITLASTPGSSDKLTIYYDNGTNPQNAPSTVTLGAGSSAIGTVGVSSLPAISGTVTLGGGSSAIGTVGVSSLPVLPTGANSIGSVVNNGGTVTLAAGSAAIGTVGVSSLPALPAGTNAIGTVTSANAPAVVYSYSSTGAVSQNTFALATTDISTYSSVVVAVAAIGVGGVISFEFSNDNTSWVAGLMSRVDQVSGNYNQANALYAGAGAGAVYASPTWGFKYFRARVSTAFTSGTNTISFAFSSNSVPLQTNTVALASSPTVYPALTAGLQGFYNFHTLLSASGTNLTTLSGGQKNIGSLWLTNTTASWKYFKAYNATTATVGTTTPNLNIGIPPNSTIDLSTSFTSMRFGTGFTYAITGGSALLDNTSVAAGDVIVNLTHF